METPSKWLELPRKSGRTIAMEALKASLNGAGPACSGRGREPPLVVNQAPERPQADGDVEEMPPLGRHPFGGPDLRQEEPRQRDPAPGGMDRVEIEPVLAAGDPEPETEGAEALL